MALWLYEKRLTVAYADEPLAEYSIVYQPDRRLREIADPNLFETPFRSSQPLLWETADGEWLKVPRLPEYAPRRRRGDAAAQPPLLPEDLLATLSV